MPMVCELLNVRETLRYRDPQPRRKPLPRRLDPELEVWAVSRAAELVAAGHAVRVERPRGQAPVVVYRLR
jgi:anti-sigma-K factor RskA